MDKKIVVAIIVVFLLNSTVMLIGFGILQNEIDQLKPEEPSPSTTEPEQLQELDPEPTLEPKPQPTPEPEPEPEPAEPTHKLIAPVANLSLARWKSYNNNDGSYSGFSEAKIQGSITNLNNCTIYFVKKNLNFSFNEVRGLVILGEHVVDKTIRVGTLKANKSITIDESFDFPVSDMSGLDLRGFSYLVDWVE